MKKGKIIKSIICIIVALVLIIYSRTGISDFFKSDTGYVISQTLLFIAIVVSSARGISLFVQAICLKNDPNNL